MRRPGDWGGEAEWETRDHLTQAKSPDMFWLNASPRIHMPRPPRLDRKGAHAPQMQDTVRLSAEGLAKVLGDLEARVLRTVWSFDRPAPAREIHERLVLEHQVSHLTTITVLNKLVTKGILARTTWDDLLHYSALLREEQFMKFASRRVVEGILSLQPDAITASFVDVVAERRPEELEELAKLVRQRIRERNAGRAAK